MIRFNNYNRSTTAMSKSESLSETERQVGALDDTGFGELKTKEQILNGELKSGAAIQVFTHSTVKESVENGFGHSFIFLNYTYDENNNIVGMKVADQGYFNSRSSVGFDEFDSVFGANLGITTVQFLKVSIE